MTANGDTIPGAVIVDDYDGHTWHEDEAGRLLTVETATELAGRFNGRLKTGHAAHRFRVFTLTPPGPSEMDRLQEAARDDYERDHLTEIARRAGLLWQCDRYARGNWCGWDNREDATTCGGCGQPRPVPDDCAICVPGQCPGPDCPGNRAHEPGSYEAGECTCTRAHDGRGLACAGCPVHDPITTGQEQQQ